MQSTSNTIGGTVAGANNVISGNTNDGVLFDNGATGNLVQGNLLGLSSVGKALGDTNGIVDDAGSNTIGGSTSAARNYISANSNVGIILANNLTGSLVQGNFIGTNAAGTAALGNKDGILISGVSNTIGSTVWAARNVISGNSNDGILIGSTGKRNTVQDNIIGANVNSSAAVANSNGIEIAGLYNTIGGTNWATNHNVISGNSNDGVLIDSTANDNGLDNNIIGLTSADNALGNGGYGVSIAGSYTHEGANYIANNGSGGVFVSQGNHNVIQDDGTYANGTAGQGPGMFSPAAPITVCWLRRSLRLR